MDLPEGGQPVVQGEIAEAPPSCGDQMKKF